MKCVICGHPAITEKPPLCLSCLFHYNKICKTIVEESTLEVKDFVLEALRENTKLNEERVRSLLKTEVFLRRRE